MARLVLASSSQQRQNLLRQLGLDFTIYAPNIDESLLENEPIISYVERLAREKTQAVLQQYPDAVVLGADTSMAIGHNIIGKPHSKAHAFEIWTALGQAKTHQVFTGLCVADKSQILSCVVETHVEFKKMSTSDMHWYWDTGEPIGKAGAYAIQGIAGQFISRIEGSYSNIVGLPLYETMQLLKQFKGIVNLS